MQLTVQISKELEVYRRVMGTFGFDMAINDRKNIMPSKFHFVYFLCFIFQISNVFSYVSPIHCRYLVGNL